MREISRLFDIPKSTVIDNNKGRHKHGTSYRTKVLRSHKSSYDRKINVRVRRNRHKLSYDGIVRNSYDILWPFRPSYECILQCILHSYDSLCRCLWGHDSLWRPLQLQKTYWSSFFHNRLWTRQTLLLYHLG